MDVQASCDELAGIFVADACRERANPSAAVLERAAKLASSRPRCQQLIEQVTVALLEIDEVETDPVGQTGGGRVHFQQPIELVVADQWELTGDGRTCRLVDDCSRVEQGAVLGQDRPFKRITAGVGQLESDQEVVIGAAEFDVGPAAGCDDLPERRCRGLIDQELAGIGPSLRNHGAGLHRLDRQPVADRPTTHAQRRAQRSQVVLKLHLQPESAGVVPQRLARLVLEIARHNRLPLVRLEWRHARTSTGATAFDLAIVARRAAPGKVGSKRARLNRSALDAPLDEPFPIAIELIQDTACKPWGEPTARGCRAGRPGETIGRPSPREIEGAPMSRRALVQIGLVLVGVMWIGTQRTTVRADEDPRTALQFLRELRDHGLHDLALQFIDELRVDPGLPANLKVVLDYQEGRTEIDEAAKTGDLAHRRDLLDQARTKLESFVKAQPNHPLARAAIVQGARLLVERGHLALLLADDAQDPAQKTLRQTEARASFAQAREAFARAVEQLELSYKSFSGF